MRMFPGDIAEQDGPSDMTLETSSSNTTLNASMRWSTKELPSPASTAFSLGPTAKQPGTIKRGPVIRDTIIGFADGLTVPFALTAALTSLGSSRLVIDAGLAELAGGSISMGLGAYLAAITERDHFRSEQAREKSIIQKLSLLETEERVHAALEKYGVERNDVLPISRSLRKDPAKYLQFIMETDLGLEESECNRAWMSAVTMGAAYFIGGLIPMIPYFVTRRVLLALFISIGITVFILLLFGYVKTRLTVRSQRAALWGALQTLLVGSVAAGASYGIVRGLNSVQKGGQNGL